MKSKFAVATKIVAADGSGDFDDIQEAINDLPSEGGVVYVKEGTYNISSTITILKSNVHLIGAGRSTILFLVNGSNCDIIHIGDGSTALIGIEISNLQINGNKANNSGYLYGIKFWGGSGNEITNSILSNNWLHDCKTHGLWIKYSDYTLISGNQINSNDDEGIMLDVSDYISISGNQINSNGSAGIAIDSTNYTLISGNQINSNSHEGIVVYTADIITISGNQINSNGSAGTSILGDYILILGNQINLNGNNGITLEEANYSILLSNLVTRNTGIGINIPTIDSKNNLLANNYCTGNTTTNISDTGTGTKIINNIGYNPIGVSAISVDASPFTYTAGASPETVYIYGGTVSDISKSSITLLTNTNHSIKLEPHESVTITYSSAPTMKKDVH